MSTQEPVIRIDGLEVFHHKHGQPQTENYALAADRLGLVKTGGSDLHHHYARGGRELGCRFCDWDQLLPYLKSSSSTG